MDGKDGVTAQRIVTEPPTEAYTGSAFVIVTVCWDGAMRGREGEREREREREREEERERDVRYNQSTSNHGNQDGGIVLYMSLIECLVKITAGFNVGSHNMGYQQVELCCHRTAYTHIRTYIHTYRHTIFIHTCTCTCNLLETTPPN